MNISRRLLIILSFIIIIGCIILYTIINKNFFGYDHYEDMNEKSQIVEEDEDFSNDKWEKLFVSHTNNIRPSLNNLTKPNIYATFLASEQYLPALEVFTYSLIRTKPQYVLVIAVPKIPTYKHVVNVTISLLSKYNQQLSYEIHLWPVIKPPKRGRERDRWTINWTKLQLWTMVTYAKIFYVDLDVMFMKNVDDVFDYKLPPIGFLGTYDWGRWTKIGTRKMNGGVFLVHPSLDSFIQLLKARHQIEKYSHKEAEQGLFNYYFLKKHNGCCLPVYYNVQKTLSQYEKTLWHMPMIYILHFTGEKPWTTWSTDAFRNNFVSKTEKTKNFLLDSWDAHNYQDLHVLWKETYFKARKAEFSQLTMFQSYNNITNQWAQLYHNHSIEYKFVYVYNFSTSQEISRWLFNDQPSTRTIYNNNNRTGELENDTNSRILKLISLYGEQGFNVQAIFGDTFLSMLMVENLSFSPTTKYVGFTDWKEKIRADGESGTSVDWTKIHFSHSHPVIYFWCSIPTADLSYYDAAESQTPGLIEILKEFIDFPLPHMPFTHRYMYGNYFITSRDVFMKYVKSARKLVSKFLTQYPVANITIHPTLSFMKRESNDSKPDSQTGAGQIANVTYNACPFSISESYLERTLNEPTSCVAYLLEKYINIWATANQIKLVYAVDHPAWRTEKKAKQSSHFTWVT